MSKMTDERIADNGKKVFTDEQIKKGLEVCSMTNMTLECKNCPYDTFNARNCSIKLCEDALDLINRQQAEIERLQRLLKQEEKSKNSLTKKCYKDGINELADRLKENTVIVKIGKQNCKVITVDGIDYYKKEMVGEGK